MAPSELCAIAVGLGGNVGAPDAIVARFRDAVQAIADVLAADRVAVSRLYRSEPVGPVADQPAFVNAVARFDARVPDPIALMAHLLRLERAAGRVRERALAKGPRTLDLDLLLVGDVALAEAGPPAVIVPHPALLHRRFVLAPLCELYPASYVVPGTATSLGDALAREPAASQQATAFAPSTWLAESKPSAS